MSSSSASSEPETAALAAALARELPRGAVVYVEGELGAGKTAFVRGAARALGVDGRRHEPDVHGRAPLRRATTARSRISTSRAASASTRRPGAISSRTSTTSAPSSSSGRASAPACCRRPRRSSTSPCATTARARSMSVVSSLAAVPSDAPTFGDGQRDRARRSAVSCRTGASSRSRAPRAGTPRSARSCSSTRSSRARDRGARGPRRGSSSAAAPARSPGCGSASRRRAASRSASALPCSGVSTLDGARRRRAGCAGADRRPARRAVRARRGRRRGRRAARATSPRAWRPERSASATAPCATARCSRPPAHVVPAR